MFPPEKQPFLQIIRKVAYKKQKKSARVFNVRISLAFFSERTINAIGFPCFSSVFLRGSMRSAELLLLFITASF